MAIQQNPAINCRSCRRESGANRPPALDVSSRASRKVGVLHYLFAQKVYDYLRGGVGWKIRSLLHGLVSASGRGRLLEMAIIAISVLVPGGLGDFATQLHLRIMP